jgi:hypothetical protein
MAASKRKNDYGVPRHSVATGRVRLTRLHWQVIRAHRVLLAA